MIELESPSPAHSDWHAYLERGGYGGYHQAAAGVGLTERLLITRLMNCLDFLLEEEVSLTKMTAFRAEFVETLCEVELVLPPSEAKAIVNHLLFHVWDQVEMWGPSYVTWMYVTERYMSKLTRLVRNRAHPETSLANAYALETSTSLLGQYIRPDLEKRLRRQGSRSAVRLIARINETSLRSDEEPDTDDVSYASSVSVLHLTRLPSSGNSVSSVQKGQATGHDHGVSGGGSPGGDCCCHLTLATGSGGWRYAGCCRHRALCP